MSTRCLVLTSGAVLPGGEESVMYFRVTSASDLLSRSAMHGTEIRYALARFGWMRRGQSAATKVGSYAPATRSPVLN
eukprot:3220115-Rhodomonas_salina.3